MIRLKIIFPFLFLFSLLVFLAWAEDIYLVARQKMVKNQLKARGIKDEKLLKVMEKVPRHLFVPQAAKWCAYWDQPLPIGEGQTISQPYIVALMSECLELKATDRVLEIGTGSAYQAAILAEIAKEVYSIEIIESLAVEAEKKIQKMGYKNIKIKCADGFFGWEEYAPFDKIIVTACPPQIPQTLIEQLKINGKMIIPVGTAYQELVLLSKQKDGSQKKSIIPVRFVPMVGKAQLKK